MHSYAPIDADEVSIPADAPADTYAILSTRERRATLRLLAGTDRSVAVADLTRDVAQELEIGDADCSHPEAEPTPERLRRLRVRLSHCDLPKLADHGLVSIDRDRRVVTLRERGERIAGYLEADDNQTGEPGSTT